jgi:hypothetical protein
MIALRQQILVDFSDHHVCEDLASLDHFQPDVALHCRANAAMTQDLSNELKLAWSIFENDGTGGMPELVDRHPQPGCFFDVLNDLVTERGLPLRAFP